MVFEDNFRGKTLDRRKWAIVYDGGQSPGNQGTWDPSGVTVNNGLNMRIWKDESGWRISGISQFNSRQQGYTDFCAQFMATIPAAQGIGPYVLMWPSANDTWPPEFDMLETPDPTRQSIQTTWHWQGRDGNGDNQYQEMIYKIDATKPTVYAVQRLNGNWIFWINGVQQKPGSQWNASYPGPVERMSFDIGSFVADASTAAWYGGGVTNATPTDYTVHYDYVRIWAPAQQTAVATP